MIPPASNTGGNFLQADQPHAAVNVDWLSVSFPRRALEATVPEFVCAVRRLFDGTVAEFTQSNRINGYAYSVRSDVGSVHIAWGGNNDTVFLKIPGDGCARVRCWATVADFIGHRAGHITRADVAFDDFGGQHSVDLAVALYLDGGFSAVRGGARSGVSATSCSQAGNWIAPDGSGRTFNVGKLKNGKMLCVYEKGRQLGDPTSHWVRWEVRFANRDRAVPLALLTDPGSFARGAYPALSFIDGDVSRIGTRRMSERICLGKLTHHARESYGPLLDVLQRSGVEAAELIERIRRPGVPKRLGAPTENDLIERFNWLCIQELHREADLRADLG